MASAIDAAFGDADPRVRSAAGAVASMPEWLERRRLDLWESEVEAVLPEGSHDSLPMNLLVEVFQFGQLNLYGAFHADETSTELRRVGADLSRAGLEFDQPPSVSDW